MNWFPDDLARWSGRVVAVEAHSGATHTYANLLERADGWLASHPLPGAVFLAVDNSIEGLAAYVACLRARRPMLLIPPEPGPSVERLVERFRPRYIAGFSREPASPRSDAAPVHEDLALLLSTSGSTGGPKLVRLSRANIEANTASICSYLGLGPDERAATTLVPHYSFGMSVWNTHLASGASLWLTGGSVVDEGFWEAFERNGCTSFSGVPYTFESLAARGVSLRDLPLHYAAQAGGRLAPDLVRRFAQQALDCGREFYVMYGQTEAGPRMSYMPAADCVRHPDCIGRAVPGGELYLEPAPDAARGGMLCYRGPNVMMGYAEGFEDLAAGAAVTYLRTGDLAEEREPGVFAIVGRASRFVKPFGLRIDLDELERWLRVDRPQAACAGTDTLIVCALPDARDAEATAEGRRVAEHLKLPPQTVRCVAVDVVPRLPNGKVDSQGILALGVEAREIPSWLGFARRWAREAGRLLGIMHSEYASVKDAFENILGREVAGDTTFASVGDSLTYVHTRAVLDELLPGGVPAGWEHLPVDQLEAMRTRGPAL